MKNKLQFFLVLVLLVACGAGCQCQFQSQGLVSGQGFISGPAITGYYVQPTYVIERTYHQGVELNYWGGWPSGGHGHSGHRGGNGCKK